MDVEMRAGDDLLIQHTVTNTDGTVRNITGATGTIKVYDKPRGTLKITGSFSLVSGAAGTAQSALLDTQTDTYQGEFHVFYYETKLTESDGRETVIESGKLTVV